MLGPGRVDDAILLQQHHVVAEQATAQRKNRFVSGQPEKHLVVCEGATRGQRLANQRKTLGSAELSRLAGQNSIQPGAECHDLIAAESTR